MADEAGKKKNYPLGPLGLVGLLCPLCPLKMCLPVRFFRRIAFIGLLFLFGWIAFLSLRIVFVWFFCVHLITSLRFKFVKPLFQATEALL